MLNYESADARPRARWGITILLGLCAGAVIAFIGWSPWPHFVSDRVAFVIAVMAIVGIPFGIKYGTQDKDYF